MIGKRILYLTQTYPFPANDGGEQGLQKHVIELCNSKYINSIKMVFSTFNKPYFKEEQIKSEYKIFSTKIYKNKFSQYLGYLLNFFFSKYSYSYNIVDTKELRQEIKNYNPDLTIMDHIICYKALKHVKINKNFIYIAHNLEFEFNKDVAKLEKNILKKTIRYICALKAFFIEKEVTQKADAIICVSTSDYNYWIKHHPNKTYLCPLNIDKHNHTWNGNNSNVLFFCGPADFYPNREALDWLLNTLAPQMPNIKFKIAGKKTDELPSEWKKDNVELLGFVSKEELYNLYRESAAFICPIIYGSGVKVKLLEALGFYIPIIATKEALSGLEYFDIDSLIDRNNIELTKNNINKLINNKTQLLTYSINLKNMIDNYENNKNTIVKVITKLLENYKNEG